MSVRINAEQDVSLRGAAHQQTTKETRLLLFEGPCERLASPGNQPQVGVDPALQLFDTRPQAGLRIQTFEVHNRSGGVNTVGIGFRYQNSIWRAGTWDNSLDTFARTAAFQERTAQQLGPATLDDNDGIVILSRRKFNWASMNVTVASVHSADTIAEVRYSNETGDGWNTVAANQALDDDFTFTGELATGEAIFAWAGARDWGKSSGLATGIPDGYYAWNIRFTTSPDTTDPVVTGIEIGTMKFSGENLVDDGFFENEQMAWIENDADGIVAYYLTAAQGNFAEAEVSHAG